ncbi:SEC-C domain-containing protein [Nocardiopsis sediminis]|uniref:SEC-C domain-containing protein n=1 Tax=Nocardiopsis sediminis TaxID=1778267 RepID=A0ABV8FKL0_9ACTN
MKAAKILKAMERELREYPESAGEIMVDAAGELGKCGAFEQSLELCDRIIAGFPAEDAGYAHSQRIEMLYELGRDDEAEAALAALWELDDEAPHAAPMVAELLESRGDARRALRWSDRAFADALSPGGAGIEHIQNIADLMSAQWRADLRRRLGMAPDDLDRLVERNDPFREIFGALGVPDPEGDARAALGLAGPSPAGAGQAGVPLLSHFIRADVMAAHAEGLLTGFGGGEEITPDGYFREVELNRRQMQRETEFSKGRDVPVSMADVRAYAKEQGVDVLTPEVRLEAASAKFARGGDFPVWPPERNASCWCASGRKYKKCCGRP